MSKCIDLMKVEVSGWKSLVDHMALVLMVTTRYSHTCNKYGLMMKAHQYAQRNVYQNIYALDLSLLCLIAANL